MLPCCLPMMTMSRHRCSDGRHGSVPFSCRLPSCCTYHSGLHAAAAQAYLMLYQDKNLEQGWALVLPLFDCFSHGRRNNRDAKHRLHWSHLLPRS